MNELIWSKFIQEHWPAIITIAGIYLAYRRHKQVIALLKAINEKLQKQ